MNNFSTSKAHSFISIKLPVVLPYLPAPRADPSQETSPCLLQVSPGRLYTSKLLYLYFVIRRGHPREAHQASFGVSPPTSACVHSVTSSAREISEVQIPLPANQSPWSRAEHWAPAPCRHSFRLGPALPVAEC